MTFGLSPDVRKEPVMHNGGGRGGSMCVQEQEELGMSEEKKIRPGTHWAQLDRALGSTQEKSWKFSQWEDLH